MKKSIHTHQYNRFLALLKKQRLAAGVTQIELARRLRSTQSTVSKCERGERRLDIIELKNWCRAIEISLPDFVSRLERELNTR